MEAAGLLDKEFWKGRRVLVTGHTGFKGGWLTLLLTNMGAKVHGYSLAPEGPNTLFDVARLSDTCTSTIADIRDGDALQKAFNSFHPEIVIHLAAQSLVRRSYQEPLETFSVNVLGTCQVLEACRKAENLRAVLVTTTDKVYENPETGIPFKESDPLGGSEPYSLSKAATEMAVRAWRLGFLSQRAVPTATMRSGNVIGGGDWSNDRLIPDAITSFLSGQRLVIRNPTAVRPWQHVVEPIYGYLLLAQRLVDGGEGLSPSFNFGPAAQQLLTVEDLVKGLVKRWGGDADWVVQSAADDLHEAGLLTLDSELANCQLGWKPTGRVDQALDFTVDWYRLWNSGVGAAELQGLMIRQINQMTHADET